ncbi:MAG: hypothetical protein GY874_16990 [Desulfobacteraceae bacterium]|nr:hypothetical protein [Desulfobacteraceae bacterium]
MQTGFRKGTLTAMCAILKKMILFLVVGSLLTGQLLICSSASAELVDRIVAVVNNDIILLSELEKILQPLKERLRMQGFSEVQRNLYLADQRPTILDQMVDDKLTDQQVKQYLLEVDDNEVDATIERIKAVNNLNDKKLLSMLEMDGLTYDNYRKELKDQLLRQKLLNRQVKSKIVITDKDIRTYYNKNREQYAGKIKYHLRHIMMQAPEAISEKKRNQILKTMQHVHQRLKDGDSFAELAKVYSQASSAKNGGDLGFFELRLLASQIRDAVSGLEKGQFTSVIDTEHGPQIFYLENIQDDSGKTLEDVKPEIEEKLYAEVVNEKFKEWLKNLRENSHIEIMK